MTTKRNYKKIIKLTLGYTAIIISCLLGLVIIFSPQIEQFLLKEYHPTVSALTIKQNQKAMKNANFNFNKVHDTNLGDMIANNVKGSNNVIGLMTQPKADVSVTISPGINNKDLAVSAGTVRKDEVMGENNYVLAGHHVPKTDWALFSGIYYHARPGQSIYVTDLQHVYRYKVTTVKFVPSTAVFITDKDLNFKNTENILPIEDVGKPMITCFSCDATGSNRIVEFGTLTKTYNITDKSLPKEAVNGFKKCANYTGSLG